MVPRPSNLRLDCLQRPVFDGMDASVMMDAGEKKRLMAFDTRPRKQKCLDLAFPGFEPGQSLESKIRQGGNDRGEEETQSAKGSVWSIGSSGRGERKNCDEDCVSVHSDASDAAVVRSLSVFRDNEDDGKDKGKEEGKDKAKDTGKDTGKDTNRSGEKRWPSGQVSPFSLRKGPVARDLQEHCGGKSGSEARDTKAPASPRYPRRDIEREEYSRRDIEREEYSRRDIERERYPRCDSERERYPRFDIERERYPRCDTDRERYPRCDTERERYPRCDMDRERYPRCDIERERYPRCDIERERYPRCDAERDRYPRCDMERERYPRYDIERERERPRCNHGNREPYTSDEESSDFDTRRRVTRSPFMSSTRPRHVTPTPMCFPAASPMRILPPPKRASSSSALPADDMMIQEKIDQLKADVKKGGSAEQRMVDNEASWVSPSTLPLSFLQGSWVSSFRNHPVVVDLVWVYICGHKSTQTLTRVKNVWKWLGWSLVGVHRSEDGVRLRWDKDGCVVVWKQTGELPELSCNHYDLDDENSGPNPTGTTKALRLLKRTFEISESVRSNPHAELYGMEYSHSNEGVFAACLLIRAPDDNANLIIYFTTRAPCRGFGFGKIMLERVQEAPAQSFGCENCNRWVAIVRRKTRSKATDAITWWQNLNFTKDSTEELEDANPFQDCIALERTKKHRII